MLDMREYKTACDRLRLDTETLEEMIEMTENQKQKRMGRPTRVVLVAAALVAALGITASAAELPVVQQFFAKVFVTVNTEDDVLAGLSIPTMAVEKREGHTILLLGEEEIDVTDDLAKAGEYLYQGDGFEVRVDSSGVAVLTAYTKDGDVVISFSAQPGAQDEVTYNVEADPAVEADRMETYTVVAGGDTDGFSVIDENGVTYHYDVVGGELTPAE